MRIANFLSGILLCLVCSDFVRRAQAETNGASGGSASNTVVINDGDTDSSMSSSINGNENGIPLFFLGNQPIDWGENNTINIDIDYAQNNQQINNTTTTTFNDATIDGSGTVNIGTTSNYMNTNTYQGNEGLVIGGGGNVTTSSGAVPWWRAS